MTSAGESSESPTEELADRTHQNGGRKGDVRRAAQRCPCGLELSLTGVCVSCD